MILLVNPPVAKPSEPPAGIARLAGALKFHNISFKVADLNLEGLEFLLNNSNTPADKWSERASSRLAGNLERIKTPSLYSNIDRYKQTVKDINRVVQNSQTEGSIKISMANYQDDNLSPTRSQDLIWASKNFKENPYFSFFSYRLEKIFLEEKPEIVGFSLNYMSQALTTFAMAGFVKKILPEARIMLGGGLVTSWIRRPVWKNPFGDIIDDMIEGPGEASLVQAAGVENIQKGYSPFYLPFLHNNYLAPGKILPYSASDGCFWNRCSFCPQRAEGISYKPLSPDKVVEEISDLVKTVKPSLVHFLDNALAPRLFKTTGMQNLKTPWYGFARVTNHLADPQYCRNLKKSGCVMLKLGLESGNQSVLDKMDKGTDLATISRVLKSLKNAGIATYVYLLFGTTSETHKKAVSTMNFIADHSNEINFLNLAIFNLPIFSSEAKLLETHEFYGGDLSLYRNFKHPLGWDRHHVRKFVEKEFKKVPAISGILQNDPPIFTSNHAPFFC